MTTLAALLNVVIPPDAARKLPGAGEVDFASYLVEAKIEAMVAGGVSDVEREAASHERLFADLGVDLQTEVVKAIERSNPTFFRAFMRHVVQCYYQDDRVLRGIGAEARPPFPDGFSVAEGDLTLLEPVVEREPLYRS